MSIYWDSHQSCIRLQIRADICTVLTACAVATSEVNCYNCIVDSAQSPALRVQSAICLRHGPIQILCDNSRHSLAHYNNINKL